MVMQNFGSEGEGEGGQKDYYGIFKVTVDILYNLYLIV